MSAQINAFRVLNKIKGGKIVSTIVIMDAVIHNFLNKTANHHDMLVIGHIVGSNFASFDYHMRIIKVLRKNKLIFMIIA